VSNKVSFGTFYPDDLNLNGDQANLLVLTKRLEWRGVSSELVSVTGKSDLTKIDFLFIGHGSAAAWESLLKKDKALFSAAIAFMNSGKPLMAVSSGYLELLNALGEGNQQGEHRSEFIEIDGVVGYLNSPTQVPMLVRRGASILTMLHGPVFAKNPDLVDELISSQGWADIDLRSEELDRVDALAAISRKTAFEH